MKLFKLFLLLFSLQLVAQNSLTSNGSKKVYFYDSELRQTDSLSASFFKEVILKSDLDTSSLVNLFKLDGTIVSKTYISYFKSTFGKKDSIIKNGPQTFYYGNGINKKISFFISNSKIGDEYQYNDKGVLTLASTFSNNILNGPEKGYHETGEVKYIRNYVNGKIEGDEIGYLKTGEIKYKRKFKNGILNGEDIGYYKSGEILYKRTYNNGFLFGEEMGYDKKGNKLYIKYYDNNIILQSDSNLSRENEPSSLRKISFFYNSGELKEEVNYLNGKINGQSIGFYKSGSKSYVFNYEEGVLQGISDTYFENGKLKSSCAFHNGKKNGEEVKYNQEKKFDVDEISYFVEYKKLKRFYNSGLLDGLETGFYPNGRIKYTQNWSKNILNGKKRVYYFFEDKDVLREQYSFKNGLIEGEFLTFHESGEVESKAFYTSGIKDSKIYKYYKNKNIKSIENYVDNSKEGEWVEYYESGKIKKQYSYESDKYKGELFMYDEINSEVIYSVNYINDLKHGLEEHFYASCEPKKQVKFLDGKKNGKEIEYYETGEIKSVQSYENGKPVGAKIIKYKSGRVKKEITNYGERDKELVIGFYDFEGKVINYRKFPIKVSDKYNNQEEEYYNNGNLKSRIVPFAKKITNSSAETSFLIGKTTTNYYDNSVLIKSYERIDKSETNPGIGYGFSLTNDTIYKIEYFSHNEFPKTPNGNYLIEPSLKIKKKTDFYPSGVIKTLIETDIFGVGFETGFYDDKTLKYKIELKDHMRNGLMQFYKEDNGSKVYTLKYEGGKRVDRKTALVIGNSDYKYLDSLSNPINDVKLISESLKKLDFKVIERFNTINDDEMWDAIFELKKHIKNSEINLIYYAGHGISANGKNYLIPTGLNPITDDPEEDPYRKVKTKAISIIELQEELEFSSNRSGQSNIIILDACRNNPIIKLRGESGGLSKVIPPSGTLFAFSTKYGDVAADGRGKNSDYARILAEKILEKNTPINSVFKKVRAEFERLGIDQTPTVEDQLTSELFLNPED